MRRNNPFPFRAIISSHVTHARSSLPPHAAYSADYRSAAVSSCTCAGPSRRNSGRPQPPWSRRCGRSARASRVSLRHAQGCRSALSSQWRHLRGDLFRDAAQDGLCIDTTALAIVMAWPRPLAMRRRSAVASAPTLSQKINRSTTSSSTRSPCAPSFRSPASPDTISSSTPSSASKSSRASHRGEWLDEIATRAAAQNEQYLELMHTPEQFLRCHRASQVGSTRPTTPNSASSCSMPGSAS